MEDRKFKIHNAFGIIQIIQQAGFKIIAIEIDDVWQFFTYNDVSLYNPSNHFYSNDLRMGKLITQIVIDNHTMNLADQRVLHEKINTLPNVNWEFSYQVKYVNFK